MTSTQVTLSGFDRFAPKAFLIALARFEEPPLTDPNPQSVARKLLG